MKFNIPAACAKDGSKPSTIYEVGLFYIISVLAVSYSNIQVGIIGYPHPGGEGIGKGLYVNGAAVRCVR